MIYVLYGQPGAGKTSLGKLLASHLDTPFFIDGDEFRGMFTNKNYRRAGREENIKNANAVVTYLNKKGKDGTWMTIYCRETPNSIKGRPVNKETHVVLCLVNPYEQLRKELRGNNKGQVVEVLLTYANQDHLPASERRRPPDYFCRDFEAGSPDHTMNTDQEVEDSWNQLKGLLNKDDTPLDAWENEGGSNLDSLPKGTYEGGHY